MARFAALVRLVLFLALAGVIGSSQLVQAREYASRQSVGTVARSALPPEALQTLLLIKQGGPFPYPHRDGSVFGNFERILPPQIRGYYREYTVPTPGRRDRGARRIVAGSGRDNDVRSSGEYYYTGDHYRSFNRIREQ